MDMLDVRNNVPSVKSPTPYHKQLAEHYEEVRLRLHPVPPPCRRVEKQQPAVPPQAPARIIQAQLKFLSPIEEEEPEPVPRPSIRLIVREVSRALGVPTEDILSGRRYALFVRARWVAIWLAKKMTTKSYPEIGRRLGGKDHTSIMHALRKMPAELQSDEELRKKVEEIQSTIESILTCPQSGRLVVDFPIRIGGA